MKYAKYRLDNSAIMYQMVLTHNAQSLFRLGATLTEPVVPEALQRAVERAFIRHPYFKTELKKGFFRPYLRENNRPFPIEEYDGKVLKIIDFAKNNKYLFRVSYIKNTVIFDFFHGLCDGCGGMEFLKTVLFYYGKEVGKFLPPEGILTEETPSSPEENEDAFERYYEKPHLAKGMKSMAGGTAYALRGKYIGGRDFALETVTVSTEKLLSAARAQGCSITVFLTALAIRSLMRVHKTGKIKHNTVAFIPVNLRKPFPSETMGNFTVFAKVILPNDVPAEMSALIASVKEKMSEQLSERELTLKLGFTSLMSKLPLLQCLPLCVKSFVSKVGRKFSTPKQTFILSNLGEIRVGENSLIDKFFFNLNCNKKTPKNIACASYGGKTVIAFTRKLVSEALEREFISSFSEFGI